MKILYVAKHGSGGNDDEGAIAHVLNKLGHDLTCVQENWDIPAINPDLVLCHGWNGRIPLRQYKARVKAFWYFDRVDDPDPSLLTRNKLRIRWINEMTSVCDIGFCTDGDWAVGRPKLHWLPQGADERVVGRGTPVFRSPNTPILITASVANGGTRRHRFIERFKDRWKDKVRVVSKGYHGREMANLIASAQVVVAPRDPASHWYWSNRIFQACGFGACIIHPRCNMLEDYYPRGHSGIMYYDTDVELDRLIEETLAAGDNTRKTISDVNLAATIKGNLYRHRVEKLLSIAFQ